MNQTEIDAIIFDMDGVLCTLDDERRLDFLAEHGGLDRAVIAHAIWGSGFESRSDSGHYSADEYLVEFSSRVGRQTTNEYWIAYRRSGMTPKLDTLALAESLKPTHKLALLTNNGFQLKRNIDAIFPELRPIFGDNIFASAEFGTQKPDPRIYTDLCRVIGAEPDRTLMIDDRPENIDGAIAAGLRGH